MFEESRRRKALMRTVKGDLKVAMRLRCRYCNGPCPTRCGDLFNQAKKIEFELSGQAFLDFNPPGDEGADVDLKSCPKCGLSVLDEFIICPQCGEKLKTVCKDCGAVFNKDISFCPQCGLAVDEIDVVVSADDGLVKP